MLGAFTTAGEYTIKVLVDPENKVQESDETNNETTATIDITMLPGEDNNIYTTELEMKEQPYFQTREFQTRNDLRYRNAGPC